MRLGGTRQVLRDAFCRRKCQQISHTAFLYLIFMQHFPYISHTIILIILFPDDMFCNYPLNFPYAIFPYKFPYAVFPCAVFSLVLALTKCCSITFLKLFRVMVSASKTWFLLATTKVSRNFIPCVHWCYISSMSCQNQLWFTLPCVFSLS